MNGYFLDPAEASPHWIGGEHGIREAACPACGKRLLLHLSLDMEAAEFAGLGCPWTRLPVLFCTRCVLHHEQFAYRLRSADTIEILRSAEGTPELNAKWLEYWTEAGFSDVLDKVPVKLRPIHPRLQMLFDAVNMDAKIDESCEDELFELTGESRASHALPRPYLNQVFGSPMRRQGVRDPACLHCRSAGPTMYPLALLLNDDKRGFKLTLDCYHLLCFVCAQCWSVTVDCIL